MIEATGFFVHFNGDSSVGIFDRDWEIKGDFQFDSKEEFEQFKEKLKETWEYCSDTPIYVESFEEYNERLKKEEALIPKH